jgi:hypothetical protein
MNHKHVRLPGPAYAQCVPLSDKRSDDSGLITETMVSKSEWQTAAVSTIVRIGDVPVELLLTSSVQITRGIVIDDDIVL